MIKPRRKLTEINVNSTPAVILEAETPREITVIPERDVNEVSTVNIEDVEKTMNNDKIDLALFSNENKVEIAKKTETEIVKTMMFNQGSNDLRS